MNTFIRKIRKKIGCSQRELGAYLDLTQGEVSHLEVGRRLPSLKTTTRIIKLAQDHGIALKLENIYSLKSDRKNNTTPTLSKP